MTSDLTYYKAGMFTQFYAESDAGKQAWNEAAEQLQGNFKILNIHLNSTIYQLKQAGLTVSKIKKVTLSMQNQALSMSDILNELDS